MALVSSALAVARGVRVVMVGLSLGASQDVTLPQAQLSHAQLSPTPIFDSAEHDDPIVSELGVLSRGLILDDDRVVLLDGRRLLFVDPRSGELWTAGGHGGGPGEFEGSGLELALFRAEDGLTIWDLNNSFRLTFLSDTGELLGTRRVNLSPADFDHRVSIARLFGVFANGSLAFVDGLPHMGGADEATRLPEYLVEVSESGERRRIVEFRGAQTSTILFRHSTLLSIAGDRVAVADTESDEIRVVDRNGTIVSRYSMPGERITVSERHLATSLDEARAHRRRGDEETVRRLEAMGRSTEGLTFRVPDYRHNEVAPPLDRIRFDAGGRLWVRHYLMPGDNRERWTVLDEQAGAFLVDTPASEQLLDARGDLVLLRARSELGVDRAVIRRLVRE